jgi:hypothetical protein
MGWFQAPAGAIEKALLRQESVAPTGALTLLMNEPTAFAMGYYLPPLRDWFYGFFSNALAEFPNASIDQNHARWHHSRPT